MAVHKVPYLEHLKQSGLRENALIGQVAQTAADAIEEQAEQITALSDKLDKLPGGDKPTYDIPITLILLD